MQLPKTILFDMDGTLIAAYQRPDLAWQSVLSEFASRIQNTDTDALADAINESGRTLWRKIEATPGEHKNLRYDIEATRHLIVQTGLQEAGVNDPTLAGDIATRFNAYRREQLTAFPGALETVDRLRDRGVRLALVTNGGIKDQSAKIERFGLAQQFDHVVISEQFGADKPDPTIYQHVLEVFDCAPSEAWMVGDNLHFDVGAPQRLGIHGIWHDPAGDGLPHDTDVQPDRVINAIPELLPD
ncbi:MAG: HAD family hydrolase [Alphaproteobacteria bacterium]|nr:HAD family hydrolase [Alphaproteobacteria bacterium]